jgi:RNA polymerase sigma factor (TIGR02999 family)
MTEGQAKPADNSAAARRCDGAEDRNRLVESLYPQLKRLARVHMSRERPDHTLQPTALINEVYLRLLRSDSLTFVSKAHFLAIASTAMRRFLIDYARSHFNDKNNRGRKIQLDGVDLGCENGLFELLRLEELLNRLRTEEPRMASVIEMKCFGGLTYAEIGEVLSIDVKTVQRDWAVARAWLYGHLQNRN